MKSVNINDFLVKLSGVLGITAYLSKLFAISSVVSLCFAFSLACVFGWYLLQVMHKDRIKLNDLILLMIVFLSVSLSGYGINFEYLKPAIIVMCVIICIDICPYNQIDEKGKNFMIALFAAAAVITNAMYYLGGLRYQTFGATTSVSLNFTNPNETGMWLVFLILVLANGISEQKKKLIKVLLLGCAVSLLPILSHTEARACMLAIVFFLVMKVLLYFVDAPKMPGWMITLVALSPIIVYMLYMYVVLPNLETFTRWFSFMLSEGKSLTSRREIWSIIEADLLDCVLIGKYAFYHSEQMHNSLGTLYGRFGAVFVLIVCQKFIRAVKKLPNVTTQLSLCTIWVIGCFETAIFEGVGGLYLLVLVIPLIGQDNKHRAGREAPLPSEKRGDDL